MDKILDLNTEFDLKLFDEIVQTALNPSSPNKAFAEDVLLRFKELPGAWTKIDCILKNSLSQQSKFIALQILEETVKAKWVLFNEEMKVGLRQYVFTTVIERSASPSDIILQKFNSVLIEIVKKDWPRKWPTFINDLISVSQSTSMAVSRNSLIILKNINEQIFVVEDDITTAKKRLLRMTLKQEYFTIFQFISLILEYSETQDLDDSLLESCLNAFKSFCRSMPPEFVFSTKIVDHVVNHLNSQHSIATIDCLMEVVEMRKNAQETNTSNRTPEVAEFELKKITLIHSNLLNFFKSYMRKYEVKGENSKLHVAYKKLEENERIFLKKFALIFASVYSNWLQELNIVHVKEGLGYLVQLSKIEDDSVFREIFPFWAKFVNHMYSEYPIRVATSKSLKRSEFTYILEAMLPVFVNNMPRPEEVFIKVNDLGEVVRDKKIETVEIDFYKKMKFNLFNLSFCIEDNMIEYFTTRVDRFISISTFDHAFLNKLCWSIGSISNALEEPAERSFFMAILKSLLSICEYKHTKEEKAIVASNVMFIIGQYHRFLKYHSEFLAVVIRKLFEFMEETYEGIKEMACDNFLKICEKCPNQFFIKKDKSYFYENILLELPAITSNLDYYLQRMVIEGMLIVLKNSQKKEIRYIECIFNSMTNKNILDNIYITNIHTAIHDSNQLKMTVHLIESYALGFKLVPELFHNINVLDSFLFFYRHISQPHLGFTTLIAKNLGIIKSTLAHLFETIVSSGFTNAAYLNNLCENVLLDFKATFDPSLISLSSAIVSNVSSLDSPLEIQRIQFIINSIIAPSVPYVIKSDEHIELSVNYLELIKALIESSFKVSYPLLVECSSFDAIIKSIIVSMSGIREISVLSLENLQLLFKNSFESKNFSFFNRYYLTCLENILGLIFDKDMRQNYDKQIELLHDCMLYLGKIPSLNNAGNNNVLVREFISSLFSKNFKNITENTVTIFIEGILGIKNLNCFKEHIDDFNAKIYEYGDDEDIQEEYVLLKERIAAGYD